MNNLSFDKFVQGFKNCKDVDELLSYLSTKEAVDYCGVYILKREYVINGFEDVYKREIEMGEFITNWIKDNEGCFLDENIEYLKDLIGATHEYIIKKDTKNFNSVHQRTTKHQRLNNTKKYQESVIKHLQALKRDLEQITPQGGKTEKLLMSINEALENIESIVPTVKLPRANTDELRKVLNYLETNLDLPKVATRSYLSFFQSYQNSHI